mgnify:CR=1 FL=1
MRINRHFAGISIGLFSIPGTSADLVQRFHAVLVHPCGHLVRNGLHGAGVGKVCGTTCTAAAPAMMNSSASRPVAMPPRPTTGMFTAPTACHTMRRAMGRTAGPDRPAKMLLNTGRRFPDQWRRLEGVGQLMASAPAASTALHISGMFSAWGLSLTIRGFLQAARTMRTTSPAASAFTP